MQQRQMKNWPNQVNKSFITKACYVDSRKGPFHFQELGMPSLVLGNEKVPFWNRHNRDSSFIFLVPREFQLISVNYNLFRLDDKKKGNRHLDKPMKPMNSQISWWKDILFLIFLSIFFSDLFVYRVNWNAWLKELSSNYLQCSVIAFSLLQK